MGTEDIRLVSDPESVAICGRSAVASLAAATVGALSTKEGAGAAPVILIMALLAIASEREGEQAFMEQVEAFGKALRIQASQPKCKEAAEIIRKQVMAAMESFVGTVGKPH